MAAKIKVGQAWRSKVFASRVMRIVAIDVHVGRTLIHGRNVRTDAPYHMLIEDVLQLWELVDADG